MTYISRNPNGQTTMANSAPVVLASNHSAIIVNDSTTSTAVGALGTLLGAVNEALPGSDTPASAGLHGLLMRVSYNVGLMSAKLPTTLGSKTSANSMAVVLASDQVAVATKMADGDSIAFGGTTATAATSDTGTFSFISLYKRALSRMAVAVDVDNAALTNTKVLPAGGVARLPSALTAYTGGDACLFTFNADDGSLYVNQGDLNARYDTVTFSEQFKIFSFEITRPANTTAYAAEDMVMDAVATNLVFTNVSTSLTTADSSGYIVKARLISNDPAIIGKRLSLLMYDVSGNYTLTDNATWIGGGYSQEFNSLGIIEFASIVDAYGDPASSDASVCYLPDLRIPFKLINSTGIKLGFITRDAFTPASGSKFYVEITVSINP